MRTLILLAMDEIAKDPQLFLDLDKAGISRKTQPGQLGFSWDESEHPREPAGSAKGGEFAKRTDLGNPVENGATYRSKFTGLEFKVTHKKDPEGEGTLPVYTGTVTKQGTGGFAKFKVGDQHSASAIQLVNHYDRIDGEPLNKPEEKTEDPNVLHTFTNEEEGVKSVVARNTGAGGGFIVSLHDTDAGDSVGISSMHSSEEEAIKDAKKLVRQKDAEPAGGVSLGANPSSGLPESSTKETPAWKIGAARYQHLRGVHQPYIGEISGQQMARMGKQQRAAYDKKRAAEWQASGDVKDEYAREVYEAFKAGEVSLDSADLHPDAKNAILRGMVEEKAQNAEEAFTEVRKTNNVTHADQVNVGDRIWNVMRGAYITVERKSRGRIFGKTDSGQEFNAMAGTFQFLNHNDLKAAATEQATRKSLLVVIEPEPRLLLDLEKGARRPTVPSGQMGFSFDEEAHPREPSGSAKGGEFKKKEEPAGEKHYRVMVEDAEGRRGGSRGAKRPYVPYTTPDIKLARELRDDARKWHPTKHGYKVHLEEVPPGEEKPLGVPKVKEDPTPAQESEPVEPVADRELGEQTKEEALRAVQTPKGGYSRSLELLRQLSLHRKAVEDRVRHGEPVPPQVVAQYPHLFVWLSHDELREALKYVPREEAAAYTEDNPERGLSKALDLDPMLLLKAKPQPGQLGFGFDEAKHPREPAGSDKGGEFTKRPEPEYKGGAEPFKEAKEARQKPKILGINDDVTTCEACGKKNLKKTVVLDFGDGGDPKHYGSDCAAYAMLGSKSAKNRAKVDLEAAAVEYALRRMKETGDPNKVAEEIQSRIGYGRVGMSRGGLDVGDLHIREDGSIGEPVGPIMTADLLTRIQNMLRSGKYSHEQIADMRGATVSQVRSIARSLPKHEPLGGHMPSHVPVGSSPPVTDTPGPTEEFRLSKGARLLVSLEPAADKPIATP